MITKTGFKYYWNLYLINLRILFKISLEYKVNLINVIIIQLVYTLFPLLFGYVIIEGFGEVIKWTFFDYLVFFLYSDLVVVLMGHFCWYKNLFNNIQSGHLNLYLVKPGIPFFNFYSAVNFNGLLFGIVDIIMILPFILYFSNFNIIAIFLGFLIMILISICFISVRYLIEAIGFFNYGIYTLFDNGIMSPIYNTSRLYPGLFFQNSKIKYLVMIAPVYFVSILVNPLFYDNYKFGDFYWFNFFLMFLIFIICNILTYFMWKKGLKKYAGFN